MNNNGIINLFKLQEAEYDFNPSLMQLYLTDYVNSKDSMRKFEFSNRSYNKEAIFGLRYYDYAIAHCHESDEIDIRLFHILYDHKVLMRFRLEYLSKIRYYDSEKITKLISKNEELIKITLVLRNMSIKYMCTHSVEVLKKVINIISDLKMTDFEFINEMLHACESRL